MSSRWFSLCSSHFKNHYDALGVNPRATQADIKAAYYKLSKLYHPDVNKTPEAVQKFRDITAAYEVIGNYKMRKLYDKGLLTGETHDTGVRSYENYNPSASIYKNKPTFRDRSTTYDFDSWTEIHYGRTFSKRSAAKMKYEFKASGVKSGSDKKENAVAGILVVLMFVTVMSSFYRQSFQSFDVPNEERPSSDQES